jgi:hypothetical protein
LRRIPFIVKRLAALSVAAAASFGFLFCFLYFFDFDIAAIRLGVAAQQDFDKISH